MTFLSCGRRHAASARARAAFTLVEALVSLAITGIILVACGSAISLASKTMTNVATGPGAQTTAAMDIVTGIASDVRLATAFSERTSSAITFSVPDRTGDGLPETIRYAWSGSSGATITVLATNYAIPAYSLVRQDNGGPPVTVSSNVQRFSFNYLLRTLGQPAQPPPVDSADQTLVTHDGGTGTNVKLYSLNSTNWITEYYLPTCPANTTSYTISQALVQMKRGSAGATGTITLEVRTADAAKKPTSTVLGTATVDATTLSVTTPSFASLVFSPPITGIDPSQAVCFTLTTTASGPAKIYYDSTSSDTTIANSTTSNSGTAWTTPSTANATQITVYGRFTTQAPRPPTPPETAPQYQ